MKSNLQVKSKVIISVLRDGVLREHTRTTNLMLSVGQEFLYKMWVGDASYAIPDFVGVGTGTVPSTISDLTLENEVGTRSEPIVTTRTEYPWYKRYYGQFYDLAGGLELSETGLFNATTGGEMFNRAIFDTFITKDGDTVLVDWWLYFSPEAI